MSVELSEDALYEICNGISSLTYEDLLLVNNKINSNKIVIIDTVFDSYSRN
jgi:hypothetical protein